MAISARCPEIAFTTSGSTGAPVRWYRTAAQLRAEVSVVAGVLGPIGQIVNFAPTGHLYGHLYGVVLPEVLDVPVHHGWRAPTAVPAVRPDVATLLVCLPSSWPIVRGMTGLTVMPSVVALHGTGPVVPATRAVIRRFGPHGLRVVEIFGSTETGAVATRVLVDAEEQAPWTLLPDVELVAAQHDGPRPLRVRGPRLARRESMPHYPRTLALDDLVQPVSDRRFRHVGRASRLIKVNGVRCDLEVLETELARLHPNCDLVCVADVDALRGEHYDLYYSSSGADPTPELLWSTFHHALGSAPLPRRIHRLDRIPRSENGKALLAVIREHAGAEIDREGDTRDGHPRVHR